MDVVPYEGYYDAAAVTTFDINPTKNNFSMNNDKVIDTKGQARDLKWIHTAKYGNVLMVAKNNDRIEFYGISK